MTSWLLGRQIISLCFIAWSADHFTLLYCLVGRSFHSALLLGRQIISLCFISTKTTQPQPEPAAVGWLSPQERERQLSLLFPRSSVIRD